MKQFFDDEDDGKDFETETEPVSAVENSDSNSLPSSGEGAPTHAIGLFGGLTRYEPTGYTPTKEEVLLLVKHWYSQVLLNEWHYFIASLSGGHMYRDRKYACGRFELAEAAVGEEAVRAAVHEAREEFKRQVNDEWLWAVFESGTEEQCREVWEETWNGEYKQYCAADLKEMESLQAKYPSDLIALVLHDWGACERSTVLGFSTGDSELITLLEASPQFEVLTTKSRIRQVTANRTLRYRGFIRARRQGREWLFDFPGSVPGTLSTSFLEFVAVKIKKLVSAGTGRESKEQQKEVWDDNSRIFTKDGAADVLKHLEEMEKKYPDCAVALVLRGPLADKDRAVLITSATDPELLALLQECGRLEIETDRSKVKTLILDQGFSLVGHLEINRGERSLAAQGTMGSTDDRNFLMNVRDQVWELIRCGIAKNSRNQ